MKKLLKLLIVIFSIYSCSDVDLDQMENNQVKLKFINLESLDNKISPDKEYIEITAEIISDKPFKLNSEYLEEVEAINSETGEKIYGYILSNSWQKNNKYNRTGEIRRGYFLYGRCFVYGTMFIGDNGVNLFVPCPPTRCIALEPICPGEDEGYAKQIITKGL